MSQKVYEAVTKSIIEKIEAGTLPWEKPWSVNSMPTNLISRKPYRGFNIFSLMYTEFNSPYWMTFKQAKMLGGTIKRGSKASPVVFWNFRKFEEERNGKTTEKTIPMARFYQVFNFEQTEGIELPEELRIKAQPRIVALNTEAMSAASQYISKYRITLIHGGDAAYYNPMTDMIKMPPTGVFHTPEDYHATLFHECAHSTGIDGRLNRGLSNPTRHGTERYSKEELVAEFASSFLNAEFGLFNGKQLDKSAAYLKSWAKFIKDNPSTFISAANQGQRAAEFIMNRQAITEEQGDA